MKKPIAVVLAGLVAAGACAAVAVHTLGASSPVYSVSQVDAVLRVHPSSLVGHVVRVRGVVGFCSVRAGCPPNTPPILSQQLGTPSPDPPLALDYGDRDMFLATLRGLPVVGAFIPAPKQLVDGYMGVLSVRIEVAPQIACFRPVPCYVGVLQDMVPPGD